MNFKNNEVGSLQIFFLLLRKSWQVHRRHWFVSLIEIVIPVSFICLLLLLFDEMSSQSCQNVRKEKHYESWSLEQLVDQIDDRSLSIMYTPSNSFTNELINKVDECLKNKADLRGFDSKSELVINATYEDLINVVPIIFDESIDESTKQLHYVMLSHKNLGIYNIHRPVNLTAYYVKNIHVQICLDQSFIEIKSNKTKTNIPRVYIQQYPYPSYIKQKKKRFLTQSNSLVILVCAFTVIQIIEAAKVALEKNAGTNILMSINGIPNALNVLSWVVSGLIFLSIFCAIYVGLLYSTSVLCNGNPIILFIILITHLTHAVTFTIHLSAHISNTFHLAYTLIVLNLLLSLRGPNIIPLVNHRIIPVVRMILPTMLFIQAESEIAIFEEMGIGMQWSNFFDSANPFTKFEDTVGMAVILSVIGTILHFWLAIYVNAIKPGKLGIKRHPLFFLGRTNKEREDRNLSSLSLGDGDVKYFEPTSTSVQTAWIQIRNLSKLYDLYFFNKQKVHALRGVTIDFYKGQITSILGHNGAGKSTLMSILSGLTKPTNGLILVDSKSLKDNSSEILKDIGFYAQSDIFFPTLTVKEQLEFFSMIKKGGESMFTIKSNVASLIHKLKLFEVKDLLPNKLTEDQKRKLCLGIAFAADPSTLILDEPTSRLDYENKRIIWNILLEMRGRKTILVSTHDMEEADILGDRIAIMHEGRFRSYGTSLYLKQMIAGQTNIGVTLSVERWCDPDIIRHQIHGDAQIIEKQDKKIIVDVPISPTLYRSIENLDKNKKDFGVTGIELSHVGLERVFLRLAEDIDRQSKQDEVIIHNDMKQQDNEFKLQSFIALLAKNLQCASKSVAIVVTQVLAVIAGLFFLSNQYSILYGSWDHEVVDVRAIINMQLDTYDNPHTLFSSSDENIGNQYRLLTQSFGARSIEVSRTNLDSGMTDFSLSRNPKQPRSIKKISLALLRSAKKDPIRYNNNLIAAAEFNRSDANGSLIANAFYSETISYSLPISVNLVSNVIAQEILGDNYSIAMSGGKLLNPFVFFILKIMIRKTLHDTDFAFVITIYYAMAMFAARPSDESANGFKQLQRMTGVSGFSYWVAMFISNLAQYLFLVVLPVIGFVCIDHTFDHPFYEITEIGIMILLLTLLALNVLPIIYIFSFIKTKTKFALQWFTLIPIGLVVVEYATISWLSNGDPNDHAYFMMRVVCLALPYISFLRAQIEFHKTGLMNLVCKSLPDELFYVQCKYAGGLCCERNCQDKSCLKLIPYFSEDHIDSLKVCVIYLCVMPIIYFAILAVLESNIYRKIMIKCPARMVEDPCNDERLQLEESIIYNKIQTIREKRSTRTVGNEFEAPPSKELFLAYKLRKHYGRVRAVEDVSLRVNSCECFGLFGANSSGKSTILSMLAGNEIPEHGIMFLGEKHLKNNEREFLSQIGYCPQHDATLKCLNSKDHLRLFARLRGVPEGQVEAEVLAWISRLNLTDYASQPSRTLSSGTKQRLKLAIALVGSPKFVLLDEPTTHMDPGARRSFWRTVESCKKAGQTFLLASKNMDECEVLCERTAIMLDGKLLSQGTPDELKKRFGAGYDVQIRISSRHTKIQVDRIKKDMRLLLQCMITDENIGYLMYHVIGAGTTWSKIYGAMNTIKSKYDCVDDFLVIVRLSDQPVD